MSEIDYWAEAAAIECTAGQLRAIVRPVKRREARVLPSPKTNMGRQRATFR
jgi:hypothetical protein